MELIPTNRTSRKPWVIKSLPFKLRMQKQWMWPKFVSKPSSQVMMNKLGSNSKLMPICKMCFVYFIVLGNLLTKPQNDNSR